MIALLSLVVVAAVVAGIIYGGSRMRAGEGARFPLQALFQGYLYIATLIGLVVLSFGLADLLQAAFGGMLGKDFSYQPVYMEPRLAYEPVEPRLAQEPGTPTPALRPTPEEEEKARILGLDRALKEGIFDGVSLAVVGGIIWAAHIWVRRRVMREERDSLLNRLYLMLVMVTFGVITVIALPQAMSGALRYYILEPVGQFQRRAPPGALLALSIVALPIWLIYLRGTIRAIRSSGESRPAAG